MPRKATYHVVTRTETREADLFDVCPGCGADLTIAGGTREIQLELYAQPMPGRHDDEWGLAKRVGEDAIPIGYDCASCFTLLAGNDGLNITTLETDR